MRASAEDKGWLSDNHHRLLVLEEPASTVIYGKLDFNREFGGVERKDTYSVRIELPEDDTTRPIIKETAGRLRNCYTKHYEKLPNGLVDMHVYDDDSVCYGAPQEIDLVYMTNPTCELLFEHFVVPFFYAQSFFERYGEWPWDQLPHGSLGVLDWYLEHHTKPGATKATIRALRQGPNNDRNAKVFLRRAQRKESFSPNAKCLCGSEQSFMGCHRPYRKIAQAIRTGR